LTALAYRFDVVFFRRLGGSKREQHMINFVIALVVGGVIGWLASLVMNRDASMGIFWNIVVGCVGSVLGRLCFNWFTGATSGLRDTPFQPMTLLVAFGGAVVLLAIMNLITRRRIR
jgi:uncharacterized membrane protein YeaQ/YmgE (transglycosylase-associated protein family)